MRPGYTVGALAVAARRANVAGVVRLTCAAEGLEIELLRVTAAAQGFAPGGLAEPVALRVPYTAVRGLVREGKVLYLALDPAAVTPYSRFALARFAEDPDELMARAHLTPARMRWVNALLPLPIGALAAAMVPSDLAGGALGTAAVGAVATLVAWAVLREIAGWQTWGGPFSDRLRDRFEKELAERLALVPAETGATPAVRIPAGRRRAPVPAPVPVPDLLAHGHERPDVQAHARTAKPPLSTPVAHRHGHADENGPPLPRIGRPILAALAAAVGVVLVVGFLRRHAAERTPPPAVDRALSGLGAAARGARVDVRPLPKPEACTCVRADSPLWKDGVPLLSVLTFETDEGPTIPPAPKVDERGSSAYAFDLAIVNNGARGLRDVRVTITFARRTKAGKRVGAVDRGLFWGGALLPGHAAKWHVKAPGSELRQDVSVTGTLASAHLDPAPADAFFALTSARVRAVRVHAAVMLAYHRDPRADAAARALAARSPADEQTLARVLRAAAPVFACDVRRDGERLEACVFNASTQPKSGLSLREVPPPLPSATAEPRTLAIPGSVPVHEGIRVRLQGPADLADELAIVDPAG